MSSPISPPCSARIRRCRSPADAGLAGYTLDRLQRRGAQDRHRRLRDARSQPGPRGPPIPTRTACSRFRNTAKPSQGGAADLATGEIKEFLGQSRAGADPLAVPAPTARYGLPRPARRSLGIGTRSPRRSPSTRTIGASTPSHPPGRLDLVDRRPTTPSSIPRRGPTLHSKGSAVRLWDRPRSEGQCLVHRDDQDRSHRQGRPGHPEGDEIHSADPGAAASHPGRRQRVVRFCGRSPTGVRPLRSEGGGSPSSGAAASGAGALRAGVAPDHTLGTRPSTATPSAGSTPKPAR